MNGDFQGATGSNPKEQREPRRSGNTGNRPPARNGFGPKGGSQSGGESGNKPPKNGSNSTDKNVKKEQLVNGE